MVLRSAPMMLKRILLVVALASASGCGGDDAPATENCTNAMDDDGDGDIDCADSDCATAPVCTASDCGNGAIDTGEDCDGADLGGATCASEGFGGGALACSSTCAFDIS